MAIPRSRIPLLAGGAALLLATAIFVRQQSSVPTGNPDPAAETPPVRKTAVSSGPRPAKPLRQQPESALRALPGLPAFVEPPHPPGTPENQEWIERRVEEMDALSWYDDHVSLAKILTELRNPVPEIRAAALDAAKNFGSRDAIPYLEAISRDIKDPLQQKAIADLIEHLNRPTVVEMSDWDEVE